MGTLQVRSHETHGSKTDASGSCFRSKLGIREGRVQTDMLYHEVDVGPLHSSTIKL